MLLSTATLALAAFSTAIKAQILADLIPNKRTALPAGGWALTSPGGACPANAPQCDSGWCCPNSLTCITAGSADLSNVCCPGCEYWLFKSQTLSCFGLPSFAHLPHSLHVCLFAILDCEWIQPYGSGGILTLWYTKANVVFVQQPTASPLCRPRPPAQTTAGPSGTQPRVYTTSDFSVACQTRLAWQ
jgi:hypothetical protein